MSSKTKIFVFKMKELIYTGIFLALALLLILFLVTMFRKNDTTPAGADNMAASYIPGIYGASIVLGEDHLEVAVTVDATKICGIQFLDPDEAVTAMYPLMEPSLHSLAEQILNKQSTEELTLPENAPHTASAILDAICRALSKAAP